MYIIWIVINIFKYLIDFGKINLRERKSYNRIEENKVNISKHFAIPDLVLCLCLIRANNISDLIAKRTPVTCLKNRKFLRTLTSRAMLLIFFANEKSEVKDL